MPMIKRVLLSLGMGIVATVVLFGLAFVANTAGMHFLAQTLAWQNSLLQSSVPMGNIGTPEHPVYEGSPLNLLAFLASIPLGIFVYGIVAFVLLGKAQHRR